MRFRLIISFLLAGTFGLVGCRSRITNIPVSSNSEMGQAIRRLDYIAAHGGIKPDEEQDYRAKAQDFIRYAQAGDVQQMLAITSPLSHATETDSMRSLYADQVIPEFEGTEVTWDSRARPNRDENFNPGLLILGTARGKKTFPFTVAVARENGKIVILSIHKGHP